MMRDKAIIVKVTEGEKRRVEDLAGAYGMDVSTFVRSVLEWMDAERPDITVSPKVGAPAVM